MSCVSVRFSTLESMPRVYRNAVKAFEGSSFTGLPGLRVLMMTVLPILCDEMCAT